MPVMDPWGGNPMGALYPSSGSTQPPRTAKRARAAMTGRTGCLNWARPDRWELWGATPRATRPAFPPLFPGANGRLVLQGKVRVPGLSVHSWESSVGHHDDALSFVRAVAAAWLTKQGEWVKFK